MKRFFYLAAVVLMFAACSEEPEDPRAKFVGEYYGTMSRETYFDDELFDSKTDSYTYSITMGDEEHELIIDGEWEATILGSDYQLKKGQYMYSDIGDGTSLKLEISGFGKLSSNGTVSQQLIATGKYQGVNIEIEMKGTFAPE